jgi:hypothetical protein
MTTSKDVLEALSNGAGPRRVLITLGYSGWGAGQLEDEIGRNGWLTWMPTRWSSSTPRSSSATTVRVAAGHSTRACCRRRRGTHELLRRAATPRHA